MLSAGAPGTEHGSKMAHRTRIITVSGAHAGVGKTRLVERLLRALPGATAVKVVPTDAGEMVVREETSPDESPSKDTGRYLAAGARRALLLEGPLEELERTARRLCEERGAAVVVFESNSLARALEPDLAFFVEGNGPLKAGAEACRRAADVIVKAEEKEDATDE